MNYETDEIDLPARFASYYVNGDTYGYTAEEIAQMDEQLPEGWEVCGILEDEDCEEGSEESVHWYGVWDGELCDMTTYILAKKLV